jgi:hypothetical protein
MARKDERSARLRQAFGAAGATFNTRRTKRHHAKSLRKSGTQETLSIHQRIPKKGKRLFRSSSSESAALLW